MNKEQKEITRNNSESSLIWKNNDYIFPITNSFDELDLDFAGRGNHQKITNNQNNNNNNNNNQNLKSIMSNGSNYKNIRINNNNNNNNNNEYDNDNDINNTNKLINSNYNENNLSNINNGGRNNTNSNNNRLNVSNMIRTKDILQNNDLTQLDAETPLILSGMKHARSYEMDDQEQNSKSGSGKTPADLLNRKSRSLPPVEFQIVNLHQKQKKNEFDENQKIFRQFSGDSQEISKALSTSYENVIPALGSMSMDTLDLLRLNSEDWSDSWGQSREEEHHHNVNNYNNNNNSNNDNKSTLPSGKYETPLTNRFEINKSNNLSNQLLQKNMIPSFPPPTSPHIRHQFPLQPIQEIDQNNIDTQSIQEKNDNKTNENPSTVLLTPNMLNTTKPQLFTSPQSNTTEPNKFVPENEQVIWQNNSMDSLLKGRGNSASFPSGMVYVGELLGLGSPPQINGQETPHWLNLKANTPSIYPAISEIEYHPAKSKLLDLNAEEFVDITDRKGSRGRYRCGRCGQLKANHECPFAPEVSTRSISTQVEAHNYTQLTHPFLKEYTITVGAPKKNHHNLTLNTSYVNIAQLTTGYTSNPMKNHHYSTHNNYTQNNIINNNINSPTNNGNTNSNSGLVEMNKFKDVRIIHPSLQNNDTKHNNFTVPKSNPFSPNHHQLSSSSPTQIVITPTPIPISSTKTPPIAAKASVPSLSSLTSLQSQVALSEATAAAAISLTSLKKSLSRSS